MSTRLTIVRLMAVAGLSLSLTACGKVTSQMSFKDGIAAYQQQNYRVAIAELEEAVQHDFEWRPYAYFYLANSHDNAYKFTRKGQADNDAHLPEAEKYYKLAHEQIDPASREGQGAIFKKRSLEYLVGLYGPEKLNRPDQALEIGQQIVSLDPSDVNNYFGLSKLYKDMGRMEEAEQMLMRAKEAAPNSVDVQLQLAGFYNSQGNFDKTIEAFQTRIQLEPNNPEAYHTVAGYFEEKIRKDYTIKPAVKADYIKRGLDASDKAIAIKGDYVDAMVMKGLLLRQQALVEKSPAKQQELLKEANALREKAIETRNRLQGEAADAEAKAKAAKDAKKSEE